MKKIRLTRFAQCLDKFCKNRKKRMKMIGSNIRASKKPSRVTFVTFFRDLSS